MYRVIFNFRVYPFNSYKDAMLFYHRHPGSTLYEKCYETK